MCQTKKASQEKEVYHVLNMKNIESRSGGISNKQNLVLTFIYLYGWQNYSVVKFRETIRLLGGIVPDLPH